jgi:hypothetical protein
LPPVEVEGWLDADPPPPLVEPLDDRFVAELHEALPERYAKQAETIYLRHAASS